MERNKETDSQKDNKALEPDKETLHRTDPQENMEGPVSSPLRETGEVFDSDENKKSADERRESRM